MWDKGKLCDLTHSSSLNLFSFSFFFIDQRKLPIETEDTDDEGTPQISLMEMLDDLHIADDATGGEGAAMTE